MYPLFAWFCRFPSEQEVFEGGRFLRVWSFGAICGVLGLGAAALFAAHGREFPLAGGRDPTIDQAFMRHMSTPHEQGILVPAAPAMRIRETQPPQDRRRRFDRSPLQRRARRT